MPSQDAAGSLAGKGRAPAPGSSSSKRPPRTVARVLDAPETPEGDGMVVHRAFPNRGVNRIDPFLLLDEMGPLELRPGAQRGFPDHPHRGFETVTYLLEGAFEHKDSQGHRGRLGPGDVQWMTAGAGVVHSEMPAAELRQKGGRLHGFQLWVNLPARDKMTRPHYQEIPAARIPEVEFDVGRGDHARGGDADRRGSGDADLAARGDADRRGGGDEDVAAGGNADRGARGAAGVKGRVRVIAGEFRGQRAVIDTRTPITYLHVQLPRGAEVELPVPAGHNGFVYVFEGAGVVAGQVVHKGQLAMLDSDSGASEVTAPPRNPPRDPGLPATAHTAPEGPLEVAPLIVRADTPMDFLLITGQPLREPVVQYGPFVMTTEAEILQAFADYREGRMGSIPAA